MRHMPKITSLEVRNHNIPTGIPGAGKARARAVSPTLDQVRGAGWHDWVHVRGCERRGEGEQPSR